LSVGDEAPRVAAPDQNGTTVNLADVYAKGPTLVYFYPKADTPGCTAQACSLRDAFPDFTGQGVQIIGVSADTAEAQKKFAEKYNLPFVLLADADGAVAKAFGVPTAMGFAKRQSFIGGGQGGAAGTRFGRRALTRTLKLRPGSRRPRWSNVRPRHRLPATAMSSW
jgi:peroxiredoxin Q/BCP